ncbi:MAG: Swt1 family HEPN domain-containing protein [Hyphomonas sp.]
MSAADQLYAFYARANLTETALDRAGRQSNLSSIELAHAEIAKLVAISSLDDELVDSASKMSLVYSAIAAFENSVRYLISSTLAENVGENWWESCVSEKIRNAAKSRSDEEAKVRWHAQRGSDPINYTMLPNLINIIHQNHVPHFEPFIHSVEWARSIFDTLERSRNVVMHSGQLGERDLARVGSAIKDWVSQVSA